MAGSSPKKLRSSRLPWSSPYSSKVFKSFNLFEETTDQKETHIINSSAEKDRAFIFIPLKQSTVVLQFFPI